MRKKAGAIFILVVFIGCFVTHADGAQADSKPVVRKSGPEGAVHEERVEIPQTSLKQPLAVLPAAAYKFDPVVEGQEVAHAFIVENKGSAPLIIQSVKTD
ncbi:MAG: hypothetical protein JRF36_01415 [Deltaproteobacteria bacterium]|jgi:hypothetical protein|nr:hypothetical protein [Deltaproteobacteria bacterium]